MDNTKQFHFGLNNRKKNVSEMNFTTRKNVFDDDGDDDDDSSDDNKTGNNSRSRREIVNKQISREQDARRRRAQADLASVKDKSVYDYDGAYDSFQTKTDTFKVEERSSKGPGQGSRYIEGLLKAAKVRDRERDAIYERKIAREQAEEDNKDEYKGKEKFVTNSYKRKLKERKQWEAEQEEKERKEAMDDVTKKTAGVAFASFYGNLNRNVMTKGNEVDQSEKDEDNNNNTWSKQNGNEIDNGPNNSEEKKGILDDDDFDPRQGFLGGFERSSAADRKTDESCGRKRNDDKNSGKDPSSNADVIPQTKQSQRELREKKVAEARVRYRNRKKEVLLQQ